MTGVRPRARSRRATRRLRVEIRSVNHRGLDLKIRGARGGRLLRRRDRARGARGRRARRGHGARSATSGGPARPASTRRGSARLYAVLERLRQELGLSEPVGARHRRGVPGRRTRARELAGEALWEVLRPARRGRAGRAARDARARGRGAGAPIMRARGGRGSASWRAPRRPAPPVCREVRAPARGAAGGRARAAGLRARAAGAGGGADGGAPGRHARSWSGWRPTSATCGRSLARRRARAARSAASSTSSIQEIGRELNTVGSKAQDAGMAGAGHRRARRSSEKMREQAQNIE